MRFVQIILKFFQTKICRLLHTLRVRLEVNTRTRFLAKYFTRTQNFTLVQRGFHRAKVLSIDAIDVLACVIEC